MTWSAQMYELFGRDQALAPRPNVNDAEPDRRVEVQIEPGLLAQADIELVRNVLQNLLGNAHKFTSKTTSPSIRFGAVEQHGVPVYFVPDNGAASTWPMPSGCFRPFHRLHRETTTATLTALRGPPELATEGDPG